MEMDKMASFLRRVEEMQNTIAEMDMELAEIRNYLECEMLERGADDENQNYGD